MSGQPIVLAAKGFSSNLVATISSKLRHVTFSSISQLRFSYYLKQSVD